MAAPGAGPRSDGESLLRSRKRNFSEAEVSALLRCVSARRKKLVAAPQEDKVPLWQRTQIWKQVTEAVNTASGFRNRRTPGEVKKKWSDIKIEAKKRLRLATERGDDGELRPMDKRILSIIQQDPDRDCPINRDQDQNCPNGTSWDPRPGGVKQEPDLGLPTIVHVTTVKREPLLSDATSMPASTEHAQINPFTEHAQNDSFTEHAQNDPFTEHAQHDSFTEHAQNDPFTEHAQSNHFTERSQMNHVTERAQTDQFTEHAQSTRHDVMLLLLQNQQQILDTLRNMAQTFSQINCSLKDICHSLKNR